MYYICFFILFLLANDITNESFSVFCDSLQSITKLEKLSLTNIKVNGDNFKKYEYLKELDINENKLTNKEEIKRIMKDNHPNKRLYVIV